MTHPETGAFITVEAWGEQAWPSEAAHRAYVRSLESDRSMGGVGNGDGGY